MGKFNYEKIRAHISPSLTMRGKYTMELTERRSGNIYIRVYNKTHYEEATLYDTGEVKVALDEYHYGCPLDEAIEIGDMCKFIKKTLTKIQEVR